MLKLYQKAQSLFNSEKQSETEFERPAIESSLFAKSFHSFPCLWEDTTTILQIKSCTSAVPPWLFSNGKETIQVSANTAQVNDYFL